MDFLLEDDIDYIEIEIGTLLGVFTDYSISKDEKYITIYGSNGLEIIFNLDAAVYKMDDDNYKIIQDGISYNLTLNRIYDIM